MGNCSIKTTPVCFEKNCFICYKKITCKKYITCFHCNIVLHIHCKRQCIIANKFYSKCPHCIQLRTLKITNNPYCSLSSENNQTKPSFSHFQNIILTTQNDQMDSTFLYPHTS